MIPSLLREWEHRYRERDKRNKEGRTMLVVGLDYLPERIAVK